MPREPQFSRLPLIWKKLDKQGLLERFLGVEDTELNRTRQKIEDLLSARDITQIPDRFLKIIGYVVGHRWKDYRSYSWNRQRISELINKYSYKGSDECLSDLVYEHGGDWYKVVDMASLVGAYDRQGSNLQSSHYFDSDYFHPGVYQLWLPETIDYEHFVEDFEYIKPAGTKWIIRYCIADCHTYISLLDFGNPIAHVGATYDYSNKLYDMLFGFYDHIPQIAWEPKVIPTIWSSVPSSFPNVYGGAFYNYLPQYPVEPVVIPTIWSGLYANYDGVYGQEFYNFKPQLPVNPQISYVAEILGVANARVDFGTLSFNWGDESFNFEDELIPEELNWRQPLVEPIIMES